MSTGSDVEIVKGWSEVALKNQRMKSALEAIKLYALNRVVFEHDSGERETMNEEDRFRAILEEVEQALR